MQAAVVPAVNSSWQGKEVPQPQPEPNQVLVKMHASGIASLAVFLASRRISLDHRRGHPGGGRTCCSQLSEPTAVVNTDDTIRPATLRQLRILITGIGPQQNNRIREESTMQLQTDYFTTYHNLKLTRDESGVLVAEFHCNGGPFIMSAPAHTELVDAFYRISQDRANKIVILTGAGREFITDVDWSSFGDVADPGVWSQVHDEGVQALENIANICVPVIAAVEGRAHVHSDYALLASVIVAAESATFEDYNLELSRGSGASGGVLAEPTTAAGAYCTRMGSGSRSCAEREGAHPGAGIGRAVPEGSGGDSPQHTHSLHSTVEGANRARSWLRIVARRSIVGRPRQIYASQE
jgi:hypothetical protein